MKKTIALFLAALYCALHLHALTIDECVEKAEANYPLISKYGLLPATRDIDLSDIDKSWLPRIGIYGQATAQNVVPSFPESLAGVLEQMGQEMKGLGKIQYKAGVDVSQTIWDGGSAGAHRNMVRADVETRKAALDVEMYQVRRRVENLFFAILLTEEQIAMNRVTLRLLESNVAKLQSMLRNGTAMQSDVDMVEARFLTLSRNIALAESASAGYRRVLALFTGEDMASAILQKPKAAEPASDTPKRPELNLFENRLMANKAAERLAHTSRLPKIGLFAQAYYGYPGFNYFESMMNRNMSFNILAGVKVSWNIDSFYTHKNTSRRTAVNAGNIEADREVFLFNTHLQSAAQHETIAGLRKAIDDDRRIVALCANVRKAAESRLENGIIDTTALLAKISDENIAALTATLHEIELLQEIYKLKYTLNR